jgi:CRISPR-associated exonuclease Cas4
MSKLERFINTNLSKVLAKDTTNSLGDRSKYIGASDIGSCLRKAYLSKTQNEVHSIKQQIIFERGHLTEGIVAKMIQGTPYKEQVEAIGKTDNNFPLKAHIDFVVDFGKQCVVIEAKSTNKPVEEPYESWILQVQLQMGLLKSQCEKQGKSIRGYILAVDVNTGWYKTFEVIPNDTLFNIAMDKANTLANALVEQVCPEAQEQLYCSSCSFKGDCPAITKGVTEQIPDDVQKVVARIKTLSSIEKEIKTQKTLLKDYMKATQKKKVKSNDFTVSFVNVKGKESIDVHRLKLEQPEIYERYKNQTSGYSFIKII